MEIQILKFKPDFKNDFKALNLAWIEKFFKVEDSDLAQLEDPEKYIISKGGEILFAYYNQEIVGTVALIKVSETDYELAKMAVTDIYKGLGIGKKLCVAVIELAKEKGAKYLFLESNQSLTPALTMYKSVGFIEVPVKNSHYERANYKAEMRF